MKHVFLALVFTLASCEPPPPSPPLLIEVTIVEVRTQDGILGYGDSGVTTVELPDGTRQRRCGIMGKVGDKYKIPQPHLRQ